MKFAIWFFGILSIIEAIVIIVLWMIIKEYDEEENRRNHTELGHYE